MRDVLEHSTVGREDWRDLQTMVQFEAAVQPLECVPSGLYSDIHIQDGFVVTIAISFGVSSSFST